MRVAIVGSREYSRLDRVQEYVNSLPEDAVIVSGGARGVDKTAEIAARARGLQTIIFPALWDKYGKRAGFIRNIQIIETADKVVAFWDGTSKGTQHSISIATEKNKPVEIIR